MRAALALAALVGLARADERETLREAVVAATEGREDVRAKSLEALDRIAKAPRHDVLGLPWVRVVQKGGRVVRAFKAAEDEKGLTLVAIDGRRSVIERAQIEKVEPSDLAADLREAARARDGRGYEFLVASGWLAIAAAELGLAEEARMLVARAIQERSDAFASLYDGMAAAAYRPALSAFSENGDRAAFLRACREIRAAYAGSGCDALLDSLVGPLAREEVPPEEPAALAVYRLRELRGATRGRTRPVLFAYGGGPPTEADEVVALGVKAIPFLVAAIEDDTPTRALVSRHRNVPPDHLLRRQDAALECLERITGCTFQGDHLCLHMDTPERRASVVANVREWWAASRGTSQAEGVRNQLALREGNLTLRPRDLVHDLEVLAMLDGPEAVIEAAKHLLAEEKDALNGPVHRMLDHLEPRVPVQEAFRRFRENESRGGDYRYLLRYGGRATYEEIVRRFEATGKLPGGWNSGDQARSAAKHGRNWAIPIVAGLLADNAQTGSRYIGMKQVSFSAADEAAELFEELTGKDFGYEPGGDGSDRAAARLRALRWWLDEGHRLLKEKIAEDHPPTVPVGDRLLSDAEIAARVAAIGSEDEAHRREAVAALDEVTSFEVQRALLRALGREPMPAARTRILRVLEARPALWHVPTLASVLEKDPDTSVRVLSGTIVREAIARGSPTMPWVRLESRDAGLDVARRLAADATAPAEVREVSRAILAAR